MANKENDFPVPPEVSNDIKWLVKYVDSKFAEINNAVDKVENTYKEYRTSQNEWRDTLSDQAETFARKESVEILQRDLQSFARQDSLNLIAKANEDARKELKKNFDDMIQQIIKNNELQLNGIELRLNKIDADSHKREGKLWTLGIMWVILVALIGWYISTR